MQVNNRYGFENHYGETCFIHGKEVPKEVFLKIFSYLGNWDKSANMVCKDWNAASIAFMKDDLVVVDNFLELSGSTNEIFEVRQRAQFRYSINKIKYVIVKALKGLDDKALDILEKKSKGEFDFTILNNIFNMPAVYKKLDEFIKYKNCKNILAQLALWNDMDAVQSLMARTTYADVKDEISIVYGEMIHNGDFKRVVDSLKEYHGDKGFPIDHVDYYTAERLSIVVKSLIKMNNLDVLSKIVTDYLGCDWDLIYYIVAEKFISEGDLERGDEMMKFISDGYESSSDSFDEYEIAKDNLEVSNDSSDDFLDTGFTDGCSKNGDLESSYDYPVKYTVSKEPLYAALADGWFKKGDLERSNDFVRLLSNKSKGEFYGLIAIESIKTGDNSKAFEIAKNQEDEITIHAHNANLIYYLELEDIKLALESAGKLKDVASRIEDKKLSNKAVKLCDEAFVKIAKNLEAARKYEESLDVLELISPESRSDFIISNMISNVKSKVQMMVDMKKAIALKKATS